MALNVMELVAKITLDSSEYKSGLSSAKKAFSVAANGIKIAAAAGAAATVALVKSSVENYAEYEQLVGGVDTLFKESSNAVQQYAADAYKTAGLSANEYMETVTSFSASLLQSLGGDTKKAAEIGDMAISDMADNANKMGTSMESIQNAYQGFAKQNYTMLDNLKLGYGGTKSEMERLLEDATKLSGIEYNLNNLSDVYNAIHVIQDELGITGTTAKEASETISGSLSSMKSAWSNLITGVADENANFSELVDNFVGTVYTAADNMVPRIEQALTGIGKLVEGLAPVIADALPELVTNTIPQILKSATSMVFVFIDAIIDSIPAVAETASTVIVTLAQGLIKALPELLPKVVDVVISIANMLTQPEQLEMVVEAAIELILALTNGLIQALPQLIRAAPIIIKNLVQAIIAEIPQILSAAVQLIAALAAGIIEAIPELGAAILAILFAIGRGLHDGIVDIIKCGKDIVNGLKKGIFEAWYNLKWTVKDLVENFINTVKDLLGISSPSKVFQSIGGNVVQGLLDGIKGMWTSFVTFISSIFSGIVDSVKSILGIGSGTSIFQSIGQTISTTLWNGISGAWHYVTEGISNAFSSLVDSVKKLLGIDSGTSVFYAIGTHIVSGLWEGIKSLWDTVKTNFSSMVSSLVQAAEDVLDIGSPSKVFEGIGKYVGEGLKIGIDYEAESVSRAARDLANDVIDSFGDIGTFEVGSNFTRVQSGNIGKTNTPIPSTQSAETQPITIIVQSVLDGRIIGETAYKYNREQMRMKGA